ncbi:MAG TPA: glycosyltransferase family 87 protein [Thermomicrobiales bacterium]|jgi:hypothetical protein
MRAGLSAAADDIASEVDSEQGQRSPRFLAVAFVVAMLLLLAAFQLLMWYVPVQGRGGPDIYARGIDFAATLTGARVVRDGDGKDLYDLAVQRRAQARVLGDHITLRDGSVLPYLHPPFEALLVAPLLALSYGTLYLLWSGLILVAFGGSLTLLARTLPLRGGAAWLLPAALCSYQGLYQSLWLGQSSPLVLLGLTGAYVGLRRGRDGWAGVALALVAIKPQMLLVVGLVLLLMRRWRPLLVCGALLAAVSVAVMPVLGVFWPLRYARFLSGIAQWGDAFHEYPAIMHNWRGLTFNLFNDGAPWLVGPSVTVLTIMTFGGLGWAWWRARGVLRAETWGVSADLLWALACLLAVLVAPHLYTHDLTTLALPAWIIVARLIVGARDRAAAVRWSALLWSVYLLGFLLPTVADRWPAAPVVPTVILFAVAAVLLIRQIDGVAGVLPRRDTPAADDSRPVAAVARAGS